jgi:hypothetical protein
LACPARTQAHHFRGKANFNNSEFWTAIDDQTEAIKHDPELFDAYLDRYDIVILLCVSPAGLSRRRLLIACVSRCR